MKLLSVKKTKSLTCISYISFLISLSYRDRMGSDIKPRCNLILLSYFYRELQRLQKQMEAWTLCWSTLTIIPENGRRSARQPMTFTKKRTPSLKSESKHAKLMLKNCDDIWYFDVYMSKKWDFIMNTLTSTLDTYFILEGTMVHWYFVYTVQ